MLKRKRQRCSELLQRNSNPRPLQDGSKVGARPTGPITFPHFLELPPEIRNMIYTLALGDRRVHFMYWEDQLRHVVCQDPTSSDCGCVGVGELLKLFSSEGFSNLMREKAKNLTARPRIPIALLQICRQIHDEAIDILFATNIWDLCNRASFTCCNWPSILFRFTDIVQPKLLERIARLEFRWIFKELPGKSEMMGQNRITRSARTWSAHWERINRKFAMLRDLVVRIKVTDPFHWEVGVRMYWAAPMRIDRSSNLRTCKVFLERNDKTWILKELGEFIRSKPRESDLCIQQELVPVTPEQLPISYSILALG